MEGQRGRGKVDNGKDLLTRTGRRAEDRIDKSASQLIKTRKIEGDSTHPYDEDPDEDARDPSSRLMFGPRVLVFAGETADDLAQAKDDVGQSRERKEMHAGNEGVSSKLDLSRKKRLVNEKGDERNDRQPSKSLPKRGRAFVRSCRCRGRRGS
jgi:hypothetical protein